MKACEKVGYESTLIKLPSETTEDELLNQVEELNKNDSIDGYIVQLPLPSHIDTQTILMAIDPDKDVDGFHPTNFGKMSLNLPTFFISWAEASETIKRQNNNTAILFIKDMDLDIFFELR